MGKTHTAIAALKIRMQCDDRLPRNAMGYLVDLTDDAHPEVVQDRLNQLDKYIPDLVEQYRAAIH